MRVLLWLFLLFPCFTSKAEAQSSLVKAQYGFSILVIPLTDASGT